MNRQAVLIVALASVAGALQEASATPISASMNLTASAQVGIESNQINSSASWGTLLDPLAVTASLTVGSDETGRVTVGGTGSASWAPDGNSGSVLFDRYGWSIATQVGPVAAALADQSGGSDWTYKFRADADGTFTMSYSVTATGAPFGLQGWDILWTGLGGGLTLTNPFDPTANGAFSSALLSGQEYTIELRNNANISSSAGLRQTGSMNGLFEWSIEQAQNPVPEPGTLALLGLSFAGLAATRRRSRESVAIRMPRQSISPHSH